MPEQFVVIPTKILSLIQSPETIGQTLTLLKALK
mgnify:CR=1 FL=1